MDIRIGQPVFNGNELRYVADCITSGWITSRGEYVKRFESDWSALHRRPAVSCSSGTAALHLAYLAAGLYDCEILVPSLTFCAPAHVCKHVSATPVYVDVKRDSCIDPVAAEKAITEKTKAIVAVHLYGMACDIAGVMALAEKHNLIVIEDCAENPFMGTYGDFACYSFFANKHMTTGEGGMITAKDPALVPMIRQWRDGGFDKHYNSLLPGLNYRMTNMQAALGCAQMEALPTLMRKRWEVIDEYKHELDGFGSWLFLAKTPSPTGLMDFLIEEGVETRRVFPPMGPGDNARWIYDNHLCLPAGAHMTVEEAQTVIRLVKSFD